MKKRLLCLLLSVGMVLPATVVNAAEIRELDDAVVEEVAEVAEVAEEDANLATAEANDEEEVSYVEEESDFLRGTGLGDPDMAKRHFTQAEYDAIPCEGEEIDITPESEMLGDYKTIQLNISGENHAIKIEEKGNNGFDGTFTVSSRGYLSFLFPEFRDGAGNRASSTDIEAYNAAGQRIWRNKFKKDDELTEKSQYAGRIPVTPGFYRLTFRVNFDNSMHGNSKEMDMMFNFQQMETCVTLPSNDPNSATFIQATSYNCPIDKMYYIFHGGREPASSPYTTYMKIRNNSSDTSTDKIYFTRMNVVQDNNLMITLQHAQNASVRYDLRSELRQEAVRPGDDEPRWSCSLRNKPAGDYYIIITGDCQVQQHMRVCVESGVYSVPFADVTNPSNWAYNPICYVYQKGYMNGRISGGQVFFDPNKNITREEFAAIIYNFEKKPPIPYTYRFADVPDGQWYSLAITWCSQNGIISGVGGNLFGRGRNISREEIAVMLRNYARYKSYQYYGMGNLNKFVDQGRIDTWAKEAVQWATYYNIINGKFVNNMYWCAPRDPATRAETAAMLKNFSEQFIK